MQPVLIRPFDSDTDGDFRSLPIEKDNPHLIFNSRKSRVSAA